MQSSKLYYQILIVVALGLFTDGYFLYMTSCTEPLIKLSLQEINKNNTIKFNIILIFEMLFLLYNLFFMYLI